VLSLLKRYRELIVVGALLVIPFASFLSRGTKSREPGLFDRAVINLSSPLASALTWTIDGVASTWRSYVWLRGVRAENDVLKEENRRLQGEVHALAEARMENDRLKRLLTYAETVGGQQVAARVVGVNPDRNEPSVRINRGTDDGVQSGMPVVTPEGVVGHVMRATSYYADVTLYTSPRSRIAVRVQRSRARAIALPDGTGSTLKLDFALRTEDLEDGDMVITSGTDGIFPPGLVVGRLTGVERKTHGTFQFPRVLPAVDITKLEELFVLPSPPASLPPPAPALSPVGARP
jgi:rod shape-determining protein MreC